MFDFCACFSLIIFYLKSRITPRQSTKLNISVWKPKKRQLYPFGNKSDEIVDVWCGLNLDNGFFYQCYPSVRNRMQSVWQREKEFLLFWCINTFYVGLRNLQHFLFHPSLGLWYHIFDCWAVRSTERLLLSEDGIRNVGVRYLSCRCISWAFALQWGLRFLQQKSLNQICSCQLPVQRSWKQTCVK